MAAAQAWISVAGIALDLLGFLLLLREWWIAFFHENAALEHQQKRAWEQSLRHHQTSHASDQLRSHLDTHHRLHDEMVDRSVRARHIATLRARKRFFVLATILIVLGSLLQLAGQLPESIVSALITAG
ncbi:MAG: hypothetical protein K2Y42_04905 [Hyphomicrobium sp.]|jgi:hypothetical protein|uniref:hypothetical protein n=1 Tax=Hyphomicrobium sp. TaxID=82 RepID=UPI0025C0BAF4|nr:hypothetical protein [Hyphomicrobium sp.]MBX9862072.1 hypothetical protein [Hyphomicrobium sp.]